VDALPLVMFALLAVGFWFLVLRPAKARQNAQRQLVNDLRVGQKVMTTAGMFGFIQDMADDRVALEVADGVVIWMLKPAIAKIDEPAVAPESALEGSNISESPDGQIAQVDSTGDVPAAKAVDAAEDMPSGQS